MSARVGGQRVRAASAVLVAVVLSLWIATPANAQQRRRPPRPPRPAPAAGSWEIGGGIAWLGGVDFGDRTAELTRNPGTGTGPLDLFTTGTRLTQGIGLQGRLAVYLSRNMAIEGGVRFTRPKLRIRINADFEDAVDQIADETVTQYVVEGSVVYHFMPRTVSRRRAVPFLAAGAGYIRDVHDENQVIETGTEFHAAGGIKYWFDPRPRSRRFGIRGEAGISIRDGGFDLEEKRRTLPIASVGLTYLF